MVPPTPRFTLRDLPLPARWVLSLFLMAIGLGYLAAMMQLHFKSGSRDGNPLPTVKDVVRRYAGSDWPPNGKPVVPANQKKDEQQKAPEAKKDGDDPAVKANGGNIVLAIKIRTLITVRCVECHNPDGDNPDVLLQNFEKLAEYLKPEPKKSKIHTVLTGPADSWGEKSMVQAFTNKSFINAVEWKKAFPKLAPEEQKQTLKERDSELKALLAWVRSGAKKAEYDADVFNLPDDLKNLPITVDFVNFVGGKDGPKVDEKKDVVANALPAPEGPVHVKIRTLIDNRCAACHHEEKKDVPLTNFEEINRLLVPASDMGKMHKVITGPPNRWGKDSMVRAFTDKSEGWKEALKARPDAIKGERESERLALLAWLEAGASKDSYDDNDFEVPAGKLKSPITKDFVVGAPDPVRPIVSLRQIDFDSLVQSTHAHMLTFALLWTATGLIFAFTSYPLWMRLMLAPVVLLAQIADVLCWWLARLPDVGPYFAVAILGTGAIVGLGVVLQILLSLFNMFGAKGKVLVLLICLGGTAGLGTVFLKYVEPELAVEKKEAAAPK